MEVNNENYTKNFLLNISLIRSSNTYTLVFRVFGPGGIAAGIAAEGTGKDHSPNSHPYMAISNLESKKCHWYADSLFNHLLVRSDRLRAQFQEVVMQRILGIQECIRDHKSKVLVYSAAMY